MKYSNDVIGVALATAGTQITERALSSLGDFAKDYGAEECAEWLRDDPGLSFVPSWPFLMPWQLGTCACRHRVYEHNETPAAGRDGESLYSCAALDCRCGDYRTV